MSPRAGLLPLRRLALPVCTAAALASAAAGEPSGEPARAARVAPAQAQGSGAADEGARPAQPEHDAQDQADVQLLLDTSLEVARKTLDAQGDFHPFAFFMNRDGGLQRLTPKAKAELPEPEALIAILQSSFRERALAGECRAIAVVADVVIALPGGGQSDALQVGIEHRSGWCRNFFYPFERAESGVKIGEAIEGRRRGVVFPGCQ